MSGYPVRDGAAAVIVQNEKDPAYDLDTNYPVQDGDGADVVERKYDSVIDTGPNVVLGLDSWSDPTDDRSISELVGDALRVENVASHGFVFKHVDLEVGETYRFSASTSAQGAAHARRLFAGTTYGSANIGATTANTDVDHSMEFTATASKAYICMQVFTATVGAQVDFAQPVLRKI